MRFKSLCRLLALLICAALVAQISGCHSIFSGIEMNNTEHKDSGSGADSATSSGSKWQSSKYNVVLKNEYPTDGTDAFYFDESKCDKTEIEEFHLLNCTSTETLYYYTAGTNPSYNGSDKNTGYYCLATYSYTDGLYTAIEEGFYNKEKGSASMAYDTDSAGTCFACIGDTFIMINGSAVTEKFTLTDHEKNILKSYVGEKYICIDIAMIDPYSNRICAAYLDAADLEDEEDPKCAVFDIEFDDAETDITHDMDLVKASVSTSNGNILSSYVDYASDFSGNVYYYYKSADDYTQLYLHAPFAGKIRKGDKPKFEKSEDEEAITFTVNSHNGRDNFIYILYDNRLEIWKIDESHIFGGWIARRTSFFYNYVGGFPLDDSDSYRGLDDIPSIVVSNNLTAYVCSLTDGFKKLQTAPKKTTTYKNGAYFAAYPDDTDASKYILIGFSNTSYNRTTTTYEGDRVMQSTSEVVEYSLADLPFAKIYTTTVY